MHPHPGPIFGGRWLVLAAVGPLWGPETREHHGWRNPGPWASPAWASLCPSANWGGRLHSSLPVHMVSEHSISIIPPTGGDFCDPHGHCGRHQGGHHFLSTHPRHGPCSDKPANHQLDTRKPGSGEQHNRTVGAKEGLVATAGSWGEGCVSSQEL